MTSVAEATQTVATDYNGWSNRETWVVSHVDITWNSFLPYLISLTDKLEDLGFRYVDNKVIVLKEDRDDK